MGYIDVDKAGKLAEINRDDPTIAGRSITDYVRARINNKNSEEAKKLASLGVSETYAMDKPELVREVAQIMLAQKGIPDKMIERLIEGIDAMKYLSKGEEVPDHQTRLKYIQYLNQFLGFDKIAEKQPVGVGALGEDLLKTKLEKMDSYEELLNLATSEKYEVGEVVE